MIVDLIRNDLSRLALPHSVKVPQLFATTAWPTVWQMTSDVVAQTRPGLKLSDVFAALFPCGSVTGAPKWQAMKLIAELEEQPRGVYCGSVGVIRPGGAATFNVPIRTLTVSGATASCGIGSGITIDANAQGEWEEWCSKRVFLDRASRPFELLETLGWADGQFCHLNAHLARMQAAAHHFGYAWQEADARKALELCAAQARPQAGEWLRLRLSSNARGQFKAQAELLKPVHGPVRIRLAAQAMQGVSSDFVRFKTTRRAHYDAFAPSDPEVFDTLLFNSRGELTEFTRGNVMLRLNGRWVTPSCRSGLLPGVGRALALQAGAPDGTPISEEVIGVEALDQASELAFVNSLRGWIPCECTGARGG